MKNKAFWKNLVLGGIYGVVGFWSMLRAASLIGAAQIRR